MAQATPLGVAAPRAPRDAEHPPTCPEDSKAAVTHLGMAFNSLAYGLAVAVPSSQGQGTDLLAVLEPASLLKHQGDDVLAAIPGPHCLSHPPQHFFEGAPRRARGWESGRMEGCSGCLRVALRERLCSSSDGSPVGSQQGKSQGTSSTGHS